MAIMESSFVAACKATKNLQETEQLKAHVAELQKESHQLGNDLKTATADRDALTKKNEALKAEMKVREAKRSGTKAGVESIVGV